MNSAAVMLAPSGKGSRGPRQEVTTELVSADLWPTKATRRLSTDIQDMIQMHVGQVLEVKGVGLQTLKKHAKEVEAQYEVTIEVGKLTNGKPGVRRIA